VLILLHRAQHADIEDSLKVVKVRGDGKCMFRAIALALARNQGRFLGAEAEQREADNLRLAVAEALCRTPKRRNQFPQAVIALEAEDNLRKYVHCTRAKLWWPCPSKTCSNLLGVLCSYCRKLQSPTFWGGEPELIVLSQMLKVPIFVYLSNSEVGTGKSGFTVIQKYGEKFTKKTKDAPRRRPVRILFTGGNHYDLLIK